MNGPRVIAMALCLGALVLVGQPVSASGDNSATLLFGVGIPPGVRCATIPDPGPSWGPSWVCMTRPEPTAQAIPRYTPVNSSSQILTRDEGAEVMVYGTPGTILQPFTIIWRVPSS